MTPKKNEKPVPMRKPKMVITYLDAFGELYTGLVNVENQPYFSYIWGGQIELSDL